MTQTFEGGSVWEETLGLTLISGSLFSVATLTYDTLRFAEFEDFPETSDPVWILGRKYSIFTGRAYSGAGVACSGAGMFRVVSIGTCRINALCVFAFQLSRKG